MCVELSCYGQLHIIIIMKKEVQPTEEQASVAAKIVKVPFLIK